MKSKFLISGIVLVVAGFLADIFVDGTSGEIKSGDFSIMGFNALVLCGFMLIISAFLLRKERLKLGLTDKSTTRKKK